MSEFVPATTKIRTRSLPYVDTDRLERRLTFIETNDWRPFLRELENRRPMRDLAREKLNIETELRRRSAAA